jgi:hypothetical protein
MATPSTLGKLNVLDWLKGMVMFVGTPIVLGLQQLIPTWTPWLAAHLGGQSGALIGQAALSALLTYIVKNLSTDDVKAAQVVLVNASKNATTSEDQAAVIAPVVQAQVDNSKPSK